MEKFYVDQLEVRIYENRDDMGKKYAERVANKLKELLNKQKEVNMVFAAAPSQNEFLAYLRSYEDIEWSRVRAFHLDEYIGLDSNAPQKFSNFLDDKLFNHLNFKEVKYIDKPNMETKELINRYSNLLKQYPIDIACNGIGENGHIGFNDPHVADFTDTENFKLVELDEDCRLQQVHDECFSSIEEVPKQAMTMTVPAICSANYFFCIVPTTNKAEAIYNTLNGNIDTSCPASIMRTHQRVCLYIDKDAAKLL